MAVEILAFRPRTWPASDWTQEELAQLYRVEHSLVQSGLSVEHDRGLTDEGDPWFVFCRPDGEVLIHLARYDGLYRLHSPALPGPLVGRSFVELTKSFTDRMPLQVAIRQSKPARLYVHPASMLALIIATIFLAGHDIIPPEGTPDAVKKGGSGDAVAAHPLKSGLQATFQSYFDALVNWVRDASPAQESVGFGVLSTLTALLTGLTDALTHEFSNPDTQVSAVEHHVQAYSPSADQSADRSDARGIQNHDLVLTKVALSTQSAPSHEATASETNAPDHSSPVQLAMKSNALTIPADNGSPGAEASLDAPKTFGHSMSATDVQNAELNSGHAIGSPSLKSTGEQVAVASTPATTVSASLTSNSIAVNDTLTTLSVVASSSGSQSSFADISNLLAHATPVNFQNSDWAFLFPANISSSSSAATTASLSSATPALPIATPFNQQAATTLESFLKANPQAQAVFNNNSIVVYEAPEASHAKDPVLNVWNFPDGSTITLVGTADHPHTTLA
jgi:hypothetical protein